jgi:hypothetical protein
VVDFVDIKKAYAELGIADPHDFKAMIVRELWRTRCADCAVENYFVLKALLADIDSGLVTACDCQGYWVTEDVYWGFYSAYQKIPPEAEAPRFGYGWVKLDNWGDPIFAPTPGVGPVGPPDLPVEHLPAPPAPKQTSIGWLALAMTAVAGGVYVLAKEAGPRPRRGYR